MALVGDVTVPAQRTAATGRGSDDGPTLGEVNRNVVALADNLTTFMAEVRATTLRQDVYRAEQAAFLLRLKAVEDEQAAVDARADANRRLALSGLVLPVLVAIVAALILANLPT